MKPCDALLLGWIATLIMVMEVVAILHLHLDGVVFGTACAGIVAVYTKREDLVAAINNKDVVKFLASKKETQK